MKPQHLQVLLRWSSCRRLLLLSSVLVVVNIVCYSRSALRKVAFGWDDAAYVLANIRVIQHLRYQIDSSM